MFGTLKQRAKAAFRAKSGACVGFAAMYMILFPLMDFSMYNLIMLFRRHSSLILTAGYIISFVFIACLSLGMCVFFLRLAKREEADFSMFFDGFGNMPRAVGVSFFALLFTALWSLLLFFPGIIASYRYRMSLYILAESPEISPLDAIRISKKMMAGKKGRLFLLDLSFIGWFLLSLVTFGIAGLYFIPYRLAADAEFYREIKAEYIEGLRSEKSSGKNPSYRSEEEKENHTWNA